MAETTRNYKVTIAETSRELNKIERIAMKDVGDAFKLDEVLDSVPDDSFNITISSYARLEVHNEMVRQGSSEDYELYVLIDDEGKKYVTGSSTFWSAFSEIADEFEASEIEKGELTIKIYRKPSKNFAGKYFITCSIVA